MIRLAFVLTLAGCYTEPTIVEGHTLKYTRVVVVRVPCIREEPPLEPVEWCKNCEALTEKHGPVINCDDLSWDECQDVRSYVWIDYAGRLAEWKNRAWPACELLR